MWDKSDGLTAREVVSHIPQVSKLTEDELSLSPNTNTPRYEKIVRIATIPITQVGWLAKDGKGLWHITPDGYNACSRFKNAQDFYLEALRLYNERRRAIPENVMTLEIAQEAAWAQIKKHLYNLSPNELQAMLAELLRAMEYYPFWMAPLEKQRGKINLIAHTDPLGVKGQRIVAQIIHKGQAVTLEGIKSFVSILGPNDFGMIVSIAKMGITSFISIFKFRNIKTDAISHEAILVKGLIAKFPMVFLSLTKCIKGMIANPNCKLNITWLSTSKESTFSSP